MGKNKASMSFLTALSLSFNNLMTKKGRTFMTAFAGSIGIIGIAAILALSNGVNNYIAETEESALTSYPLTVTKSSFDITSLITSSMDNSGAAVENDNGGTLEEIISDANVEVDTSNVKMDQNIPEVSIMTNMFARVKNNDLSAFRAFLESPESGMKEYVNTIEYNYGIKPYIYKPDTSDGVVKLNPGSMEKVFTNGLNSSALFGSGMNMSVFQEMLSDRELVESQMDLVTGRWPENYDEAVFVIGNKGRITDYTLYSVGYYDPDIMEQMTKDALAGEEVTAPETAKDFTYEDAMSMRFAVVPASSMYEHNEKQNVWTDVSGDDEKVKKLIENDAIELKIVGIVKPNGDASSMLLTQGVAYTHDLTDHLIAIAGDSDIVKQQIEHPDVDVFTGVTFEELADEEAKEFDLEELFTVDEDALAKAFSFDTSGLSGLDFSGLNFSGIDFDLGSLDPSAMNIDMSSIASAFDESTMAAIFAGAPQFDPVEAFGGDNPLTEEQQQQLMSAANQLGAGFMAWAAIGGKIVPGQPADYAALFSEYVQSDETAQQIISGMTETAGGVLRERIGSAMQSYMTNQFAPYLQSSLTNLMQQAAATMATQMASSLTSQMAAVTQSMSSSLATAISSELGSKMGALQDSLSDGFNFDADAFANAIQFNMDQDELTGLLMNFMNSEELTYDTNLTKLGYADLEKPEMISLYAKDFASKEKMLGVIDGYNDSLRAAGDDNKTIQYSDIAGVLMSSVTDIVDMISLVLIAFVSISLVVSSIMIGIITYISVLERKKEIGILRAMGASKLNIANVFNAETVIEGLIAGVFAIVVVYVASIPVNAIVEAGYGVPGIMSLPLSSAAILVGLSVLLTFIAGLFPSSAAARRDPVEALRSE